MNELIEILRRLDTYNNLTKLNPNNNNNNNKNYQYYRDYNYSKPKNYNNVTHNIYNHPKNGQDNNHYPKHDNFNKNYSNNTNQRNHFQNRDYRSGNNKFGNERFHNPYNHNNNNGPNSYPQRWINNNSNPLKFTPPRREYEKYLNMITTTNEERDWNRKSNTFSPRLTTIAEIHRPSEDISYEETEKKNLDETQEIIIKALNYFNINHNNNKKFYDNPHNFLDFYNEKLPTTYNIIPTIKIKIQNLTIRAILDTAAEISLLNTSVATKITNLNNIIEKIKKIEILSANKKKMGTIDKKIFTTVDINGKGYLMEFYLYEGMSFECLIGIDNIVKHEMILNFENKKLVIDKELINFEKEIIYENFVIENTIEGVEQQKVEEKRIDSEREGLINCINKKIENNYDSDDNIMNDYHRDNLIKNNFDRDNSEEVITEKNKSIKINRLIDLLDLKSEYRERLKEILLQNSITFNDQITFARNYQHKILIDNEEPLKCKNYPIPFHYRDQVNNKIEKMIEQQIIERSTSCYINPIVIVRKSENSLRLCLDARELNKRIKPGFEMPQTIDSLSAVTIQFWETSPSL
ncbi:putative uncharacterized protein DDB_G0282499 [Onthophagus taurus]|uniref:putative uncharacterized protein DDB_G0282499 n=1 Tax=Onthophagus taurus TaxID=166361 RepID=UPI0039BE0D5D